MNKKILFGALGVIVLGIAYWLISPLWRTVRLDEALPQVPADNRDESSSENDEFTRRSPEGGDGIKDNIDAMDAATKERFMEETEAVKEKKMVKIEAMPTNPPVVLAEAELIPRAHEVEGKALLVQVGDQKIVRFEDLKTINGPDLRIYLSADLGADDYVDLGEIRATEGNVNYTVPPGTDTTKYRNILIWCRAFSVLFSYAQL